MANPLKELELSVTGFQRITELPIEATPAKVWAALIQTDGWFGFTPDRATWPKSKLNLTAGGQWISHNNDGAQMYLATVTYFEPGKLLRLAGPMGLSHLPVINVFIFELQPKNDGKTTLLRLGQRVFGFLDADVQTRMAGGWKQLLENLKAASEKH